ncbi:ATP phosphoribosyltransferase regulatory subunit [Salirhabdus salicampi]|uniref:ATP phosphoribosyltransferase regulatory subunit n=1 Tax=Salirhabdus salicampi TaxID=476102 RepID=UPI0020C1F7F5|nr:ATP phosphoribosyltransferase regulatory subunit [Salirhabdus salicampi]MCP8616110.1 ATP phosphoribosyltransferase regulatory subunit [Salirhabdus salicampi]
MNHHIPEGVWDLYSSDFETKENTISQIKTLFNRFGYKQVQTPIFEYYELFTETKATIEKDRMIKLIDRDGRILVLRPDVTIPIARMVANDYQDGKEQSSFKLSYITNVFRVRTDKKVQQNREFTQAGVEFFGQESIDADVEVITMAIQSLQKLGFEGFTIDIGQANFFKELINGSGLSVEQFNQVRYLIEHKNFAELSRLVETLSIETNYREAILNIPSLYGKGEELFRKAEQFIMTKKMEEELNKLREVYEHLVEDGYEQFVTLDLGLINHLNYYTGTIFQGFVPEYGKPIVVGGRYDHLCKQFGYEIPATGFGIYVDDLIEAMGIHQLQPDRFEEKAILLTFEPTYRKEAVKTANLLREKGFIVETTNMKNNPYGNEEVPPFSVMIHVSDKGFQIVDEQQNIQSLKSIENVVELIRGL